MTTSETEMLTVDPDSIPRELKQLEQWVMWRVIIRDGKPTKPPFQVRGGKPANNTDPSTWDQYDRALMQYFRQADRWDGIGFVFSPKDPFLGLDLDDCRDPETGNLEPWARDLIDRFATYCEVSPTGTGVKLIGRGQKPGERCRTGNVEMYDQARFFTLTGRRVDGTPAEIRECQQAIDELYHYLFGGGEKRQQQRKPPPDLDASDQDIISRAMRSRNGEKFSQLWAGRIDGYNSHSEADLALCDLLAFWAGPDPQRIDQLFRQSGLYREEKWGRADYRERTINRVLQGRTEYYQWGRHEQNGQHTSSSRSHDSKADEPVVEFIGMSSKELAEADFRLEYLIDGLLVRGQPGGIFGSKKTLKTNISIDLAISLATATPFLEKFDVLQAARVGLMSGESGGATIQETAERIAVSKGWRLADVEGVTWEFKLPRLGNATYDAALERFVTGHELDVLIIDPSYLCMDVGDKAGNLFVVGGLLKSLTDLQARTGVTPLMLHHLRGRNIADLYQPPELEHIAWAGFQEFVRQWILLGRRVKYDPDNPGHHELWMNYGGSAGHSGLWALDIDEGSRQDPNGRRWELDIRRASEARDAARDAEEQRREIEHQEREQARYKRDRERVEKALMKYPAGETKRAIRDTSKVDSKRFEPIISDMLDERVVEKCEVTKNKRKFDGLRLANPPSG